MSKVLTIAIREFRHTVLTKAFFISSVVVPVVLILISIGAEMFLKPTIPPMVGPVAVIGGDQTMVKAVAASLAPPVRTDNKLAAAIKAEGLSDDVLKEVVTIAADQQSNKDRPDTTEVTVQAATEDQLDDIKEGIRQGTWVAAMSLKKRYLGRRRATRRQRGTLDRPRSTAKSCRLAEQSHSTRCRRYATHAYGHVARSHSRRH